MGLSYRSLFSEIARSLHSKFPPAEREKARLKTLVFEQCLILLLQCDGNNMAPAPIDPEPLPWQSTVQRKKQQQRDILSKVLLEVKDKALDADGLSDAIKAAELIAQGQLTCISVVQSLIKRCQRVNSTSTNKG